MISNAFFIYEYFIASHYQDSVEFPTTEQLLVPKNLTSLLIVTYRQLEEVRQNNNDY